LAGLRSPRSRPRPPAPTDATEDRSPVAPARPSFTWRWLAVLIAIGVLGSSVQLLRVDGQSMEHTYRHGDILVVLRTRGIGRLFGIGTRLVTRGRVVVFADPYGGRVPLVKRVVAVGGDTVKIEQGGVLFVGGRPSEAVRTIKPWPEPWGWFARKGNGVEVPPDAYFVLSDNRSAYSDSRYLGSIPAGLITGVVVASW